MRPSAHNGSSSSLSQQAEAAVTDDNAAETSLATQASLGAVSADSTTEQAEEFQEMETMLHDTVPAVHGDTADEHSVHRKLLQMNRSLVAAAQHPNTSSSGLPSGRNRLQPSEKLKGMIASSSRAFGKPGK